MNSTTTIVGNVTRDPELRFTASGQAVAQFGVAVNRRWQNRTTNEWEEAVSFINVTVWRTLAENCAESLRKGTRVVAFGRLEQREWTTPEGEKRTALDLIADAVGTELSFATAQVVRTERVAPEGDVPAPAQRSAARQSRAAAAPAPSYDAYDEEPFLLVGLDETCPAPLRRRVRGSFE